MHYNKQANMLIGKLQIIADSLGFGKLTSFATMYNGGTENAFGKRNASMTFFTIVLSPENLVRGIDLNTTYFKPTKQILAFNKLVDYWKPITIDEAIELIKSEKFKNNC